VCARLPVRENVELIWCKGRPRSCQVADGSLSNTLAPLMLRHTHTHTHTYTHSYAVLAMVTRCWVEETVPEGHMRRELVDRLLRLPRMPRHSIHWQATERHRDRERESDPHILGAAPPFLFSSDPKIAPIGKTNAMHRYNVYQNMQERHKALEARGLTRVWKLGASLGSGS